MPGASQAQQLGRARPLHRRAARQLGRRQLDGAVVLEHLDELVGGHATDLAEHRDDVAVEHVTGHTGRLAQLVGGRAVVVLARGHRDQRRSKR